MKTLRTIICMTIGMALYQAGVWFWFGREFAPERIFDIAFFSTAALLIHQAINGEPS